MDTIYIFEVRAGKYTTKGTNLHDAVSYAQIAARKWGESRVIAFKIDRLTGVRGDQEEHVLAIYKYDDKYGIVMQYFGEPE
jgi:hypothetical protein